MTDTNILKLMKKSAGNCRWAFKSGRFIATHGIRGMATTIARDAKRYEIISKAQGMQRELIDAKRGVLDAATSERWKR